MRDIFGIIDERASCRVFSDELIPEEVMKQLMEAACKAPSGGGFQNTSAIIITDPEKKRELAKLSRNQEFIAKAPVNILFCLDHRRSWRISQYEYAPKAPEVDFFELYLGVVDTTIFAHTFCLAAEAMGLASCYNGNVIQQSDELCRLFSIPKYVVPVVMLTLGYPKGKRNTSEKFGPDVMFCKENYSDMAIDDLYGKYKEKTKDQHSMITEAKLEKIYETAKARFGEEWADECVKHIRQQDSLSSFQYWLGCFYPDKAGDMTAEDYKEFFRKQGFEFA
ncbi:MAG: hypothetical protein E7230_02415 [Clostridiales bacterium]|nr:hypothetical protein [Clostridiales bacterium]